jgi:hypothetical protein
VTDRLTRFQFTYREKDSLIDGLLWRHRRTGSSVSPLVMLPGIQGGGSVFLDVALALGGKLDLISVTAPPIVDAAAMADAQPEFLLALRIQKIDLFGVRSLVGSCFGSRFRSWRKMPIHHKVVQYRDAAPAHCRARSDLETLLPGS